MNSQNYVEGETSENIEEYLNQFITENHQIPSINSALSSSNINNFNVNHNYNFGNFPNNSPNHPSSRTSIINQSQHKFPINLSNSPNLPPPHFDQKIIELNSLNHINLNQFNENINLPNQLPIPIPSISPFNNSSAFPQPYNSNVPPLNPNINYGIKNNTRNYGHDVSHKLPSFNDQPNINNNNSNITSNLINNHNNNLDHNNWSNTSTNLSLPTTILQIKEEKFNDHGNPSQQSHLYLPPPPTHSYPIMLPSYPSSYNQFHNQYQSQHTPNQQHLQQHPQQHPPMHYQNFQNQYVRSPYPYPNEKQEVIDSIIISTSPYAREENNSEPIHSRNVEKDKPRASVSTDPVTIYQDPFLQMKVDNVHLFKDIIYYFLLEEVFPEYDESHFLKVDRDIFYPDSRKYVDSPSNHVTGILYAKVVEEDDKELHVCNTCTKANKLRMILIRSIQQIGRNVKIGASITCSGTPSNSNRILKIQFFVKGIFIPNWERNSKLFSLYHHRSTKMGRKSSGFSHGSPFYKIRSGSVFASTSQEDDEDDDSELKISIKPQQHLTKHHGLLKKIRKYPDSEIYKIPVFTEIYAHLEDLCEPDSTGLIFTKAQVHRSMTYIHGILADIDKSTVTSYLLKFGEAVITNSVISEMCLMMNDKRKQRMLSLTYKMKDIHNLYKGDAMWFKLTSLGWSVIFSNGNVAFDNCKCTSCYYSHLAFVIQLARSKSVPKATIADQLNSLKIPTKQGKVWHSSLNGFLKRQSGFQLLMPPDPTNNVQVFTARYCYDITKTLLTNYREYCEIEDGELGQTIQFGQNKQLRKQFFDSTAMMFDRKDCLIQSNSLLK